MKICKLCQHEITNRRSTTFCSRKCSIKFLHDQQRMDNPKIIINCLVCQTPTNNPKFCSQSCAAIYNNSQFPKRTRNIHVCKGCGKDISYDYTAQNGGFKQRSLCDSCLTSYNESKIKYPDNSTTKKEMKYFFEKGNRYQTNSHVRRNARKKYIKSLPEDQKTICPICGYDKHVDICHIKAIKNFAETATISEMNSLDNLIHLCKNCHWEFDHGLITEEEILKLKQTPSAII